MCGIVGILGKQPVAENIVEALRRLEYRGYDSAGVATLVNGGNRAPARGRQAHKNLAELLAREPSEWNLRHRPHPLGHAWRRHRDQRPPPHRGRRRVVHNGIIENFRTLKDE